MVVFNVFLLAELFNIVPIIVTVAGFGLVIRFIELLQLVTTSKDYAITVLHTSQITIGHTRSSQSVTVCSSCSLVATFNGAPTPSSEFRNCPPPQLPASHSNSSQRLNPRGCLTALQDSAHYAAPARTAQKTPFLCCCLRTAA
jgi:hypothetical protein